MLLRKAKTYNREHYLCICDNCNNDYDTFKKNRTKFCIICDVSRLKITNEQIFEHFYQNF